MKRAPALWLAIIALAACSSPPEVPTAGNITVADTPAALQSLHRSIDQMPRSFDPGLVTDVPAQRIIDDLFEGLTTLAVDGSVVPGVAASWEVSADGRTWLFHLREARWSNGEPITATDFVYAWQRVVDPRTGSDYAQTLAPIMNALRITSGQLPPSALGATAIDARTLRLELEAPTPYLLALLTGNFMMPLHRATLQRWGDDWVKPQHMVSNGAFTLAEVVLGNRITLKKNPQYWAAASVRLDEVSYYPLDRPAQNSRFLAGDIHFTDSFSAEQYHWLQQRLGAQAVTAPYLGTFMLGMNMRLPPFAGNRALRLALSLAVDREILAARVRQGMYLPAYSLVPPLPGYESSVPAWSRLSDTERHALARRYYAEAGFGPGRPLRVELTYPSDSDNRQVYEALAAMWRVNLGAEIDTYNEEFRVLQQNRRLHLLRLFHWAWLGDFPDPYTFLQTLQTGFGINDGSYSNPQYDALLAQANAQTDNQRRYVLFHDAEALINDDAAYIPLYFYACRHLIKPYVRGWKLNILDRNLSRYMMLMQHEGS